MSELTDKLFVEKGNISDKKDYANLVLQQRIEKDGEGAMTEKTSAEIAEQFLPEGSVYLCRGQGLTFGFAETNTIHKELKIMNMYVPNPSLEREVEILLVSKIVEDAKSQGLERVFTSEHKKSDNAERRKAIFDSLGFEEDTIKGYAHYQIWLKR